MIWLNRKQLLVVHHNVQHHRRLKHMCVYVSQVLRRSGECVYDGT